MEFILAFVLKARSFLASGVHFALVLFVLSPLAWAQPMMGKGMGAGVGPRCAQDMASLCASTQRGGGQMMTCLYANKDKLSAQCKAALDQQEKMRMSVSPCAEEVKKFCAKVEPGGMRIFACLMSHQPDLSANCKAHLELRAANPPGAGQMGQRGRMGRMGQQPPPTGDSAPSEAPSQGE